MSISRKKIGLILTLGTLLAACAPASPVANVPAPQGEAAAPQGSASQAGYSGVNVEVPCIPIGWSGGVVANNPSDGGNAKVASIVPVSYSPNIQAQETGETIYTVTLSDAARGEGIDPSNANQWMLYQNALVQCNSAKGVRSVDPNSTISSAANVEVDPLTNNQNYSIYLPDFGYDGALQYLKPGSIAPASPALNVGIVEDAIPIGTTTASVANISAEMQTHNALTSAVMQSYDLLLGQSCYDDGAVDGRTHPDVVTRTNGQNPRITGEQVGTVGPNGGFTSNNLPPGSRPTIDTDLYSVARGGNFATEVTGTTKGLGTLAGKGARQLSGSGYDTGFLVRGTPGARTPDEVLMFMNNGAGYSVYNVTESFGMLIDLSLTNYNRVPCNNSGGTGSGGLRFETVTAPATESQMQYVPIIINPVGIPVLPPITLPVFNFGPGLVPVLP